MLMAMALSSEVVRLISDAERITGLTIVVHDRIGAFADRIAGFHWHRHWFCVAGKSEHPGYGDRCQAHCRYAVNARLAAEGSAPFVHQCWKGGCEAVAPVHRDGVHALTLFGGIQRIGSAPPAGLIPTCQKAWRQLPPADLQRLEAAATVLGAVGRSLLALLSDPVGVGGRRDRIERCIADNLQREVTPDLLARALDLSPSRAAHVVAELYGMSLGEVVRERRLAMARRLLLAGDEPVGVVAQRCGFANQHWFNRLFARSVGMPPARWRAAQRAGA